MKPITIYNLPIFNKLYINNIFVILQTQIIYQKYNWSYYPLKEEDMPMI